MDTQENSIPEEQSTQDAPVKKEKGGFLALFKPVKGYYVTPLLVNINIAVYILMVCSGAGFFEPDNMSLLHWGANFKPYTLSGEWWRLFTNFFVHIGLIHLLFNMYALVYIGLLLEPMLGSVRFLAAYLLTGIAASITSIWWHDLTISAGASGAIFGLYGVFLALLSTNIIEKSARKKLLTSIGIFVVYNLANGVKEGIDNAAHLGGLLSGLLIGYVFVPGIKKADNIKLRNISVAVVTILILVSSFIVYRKLPNDIGEYDKKIRLFVDWEKKAMLVYHLPENPSTDTYLSALDTGLVYWNKSLVLLKDLQQLNLPDETKKRNDKLVDYCNLRIGHYNLMGRAKGDTSYPWKDSLDYYNESISKLIDDLNKDK